METEILKQLIRYISTTTDVFTVLMNIMKAYTDGGNIASDIMESNIPLFENLSFYL